VAESGDIKNLSLLELFRLETEQQTAILNKELLNLERNPDSESSLEILMRAAHSLKGAARIVELEAVVSLAHAMEDCFVAAQRSALQLNSDHTDTLLKSVDLVSRIAQLSEANLPKWLLEQRSFIKELQLQLESFCITSTVRESLVSKQIKAVVSNAQGDELQFPADQNRFSETAMVPESGEPVLRINANRLTRLMGLSSELMVESRWLRPYADSMLQLRKRYAEVSALLEKLREGADKIFPGQRHSDLLQELQRKLANCRSEFTDRILALDDYDRRKTNLATQLYNEILASRMRPFSDCIQGLLRMVRDTARRLGKDVQVKFDGLETPVDRDILERLKAPLSHLLINAIDHGIESPQRRQALGKYPQGSVKVQAQQLGGMLVITISDDGEGIDLFELKNKILQKKLANADWLESLSDVEILEFLFLPDFSTRNEVTEFSGRGVGLDVVKNLIHESRGNIRVTTVPGKGCKFILQLPLSMSVISGLAVTIADEPYAFPLSRVERLASISDAGLSVIKGHHYTEINGELVGLISAQRLFNVKKETQNSNGQHRVVIIGNQNKKYGLIVDKFIGQKDLVVQSLDMRLGKVQDISAAALSEDGRPILIIDVDDLLRTIEVYIAEGAAKPLITAGMDRDLSEPKTILVVDDSMTVREVERQLLQAKGYHVDVAVDGIDGWNALRRKKYHLVITDVDMPRMDGIELVHVLKRDAHLKTVPIMIVSYKDRLEDKQRGLNAGADYYLTKGSFHDETLIEAVVDLIGEALQ